MEATRGRPCETGDWVRIVYGAAVVLDDEDLDISQDGLREFPTDISFEQVLEMIQRIQAGQHPPIITRNC